MKVVILGANGQLGMSLLNTLNPEFDIIPFARNELDITDYHSLKSQLEFLKPNFVINAAAYTNVEQAEKQAALAYQVNSNAVRNLAKISFETNIILIHYSTDYVFDGKKIGRYNEEDFAKPLNVYGCSKLEGDNYIKQSKCKFYIFRTSWIVSQGGNNFAKLILDKLKSNEKIEVIYDQIGVPTSAELIAKVTREFILNYLSRSPFPYDLYNLTPKGKSSFFDIAKNLAKQAKILCPDLLVEDRIIPIKTKNYPSIANRPLNSLLDTSKIESILDYKLPHWENDFSHVVLKLFDKS